MTKFKRTLRASAFIASIVGLTGCIGVRIRVVQKTVLADHVLDASLDQLLASLDTRYAAVQSMTATVAVTATSGGERTGEVKEIPTFSGYILLRKPKDLQVLLKVPVLGSMALDMVSDGKTFKLLIPPKNRAMTGGDEVTASSSTGLESLRPSLIRDSILVPGIEPDQFVTLTAGSRREKSATRKNETIEEPDYDLTFLRMKQGKQLERVRIVHISRITLLPYQQDIYDHEGRIVTTVSYNDYRKFGEIDFPTGIFIQRPIDEYTLRIATNKVVFNQKLDDEQFTLNIPEGIPVQKM